jgi:fluoride exporter
MHHLLIVGAGGFIGSVLRYWLASAAQRWAGNGFPAGTLVVNTIGCLAIGAVWSLVEHRQWFSPELRTLMTVGILGGFTTFSAFGHETFMLLRDGKYVWAMANVVANVVVGMIAVASGWLAAKTIP